MAIHKLTDLQCRKALPGAAAIKLFDGHGLYLFISPKGAKVWRIKYRLEGKEQVKVLGPYPLLGLADARQLSNDFRRDLLLGVPQVKAEPAPTMTFSQAVAAYWATRAGAVSEGYIFNATRGLAMHLEPDVGHLLLDQITDDMLLTALLRLDAAQKFVYARRIKMWASLVFDWAKARKYCKTNPAALINAKVAFGRKKRKHFPSLPLSKMPEFWQHLAREVETQSSLGTKLLARTWVRTKELRQMRWDQIEGSTWRVPASAMKKDREHLVPLSRQALALLQELKARCRSGPLVFPGKSTSNRPMSENAVLDLIERMGYKGQMSGHGFRSVASTWGNEHEYNKDHIEMQLAHDEDEDESRGAYNNALYMKSRIKMMQDYSDWLDGLLEPAPSEHVNASSVEG